MVSGFCRVCFGVYVVLVWGLWMLGLGFLLFWFRVELLFRRVCFGVGLWFVLTLVWGLLRVCLGFVYSRSV